MGDPRKLSFSTGFNQPKIIVNTSSVVSIPVSAPNVADTVLTVGTGVSTKPLPPRIAIEYSGTMCPAYGNGSDTFTVIGINIGFIAYFNGSNQLVVKSYSQELGSTNITIYYRIYKDAKPA